MSYVVVFFLGALVQFIACIYEEATQKAVGTFLGFIATLVVMATMGRLMYLGFWVAIK